MDYVNICQLCIFCKKGSHVFKVDLNCFDDKEKKKKMQQLVEQLTSMAFEQ